MIVKNFSLIFLKYLLYFLFYYLVNMIYNINLFCIVVILVEGYDLFLEIRVFLLIFSLLCILLIRYLLIKVNNKLIIYLKKYLKNNRISGKFFFN